MLPRAGRPIRTVSGIAFWPLDPRADEVRIEDIAHALSNICRFGGHCSEFYSVAQHSVWVAKHVAAERPELALHALLHDAAEAYVGDVVQPLKGYARICESMFSTVERRIQDAISEAFGLRPLTVQEDQFIRDADALALATEARDLMGNPQWPDLPLPAAGHVFGHTPTFSRVTFLDRFGIYAHGGTS